jgi:flavin reductase (DIM6/NTAB) family NADH-FMN oxidoreductase RutF
VKDARVSFECKTEQVLEFGDLRTQLLIGRVLAARVADLCYEKGRIPAEKLQPICRLGGPFYAQLGAIHYMEPVAEYFQDPRPGSP